MPLIAGAAARRVAALAALATAAAAGCVPVGGGTVPSRAAAGDYQPVVTPFAVHDSAGRLLSLPFLGGFNVPRPQLLDVDGDGDLDLFVQERAGEVMLFARDGDADGLPRFVLRDRRFGDGGLPVGEWYRFADVDLDGDLDLLTEQPFSHIRYLRNDGAPGAPRFVPAADTLRDVDGQPIFADRQNIPQLGDLDCNGRADLLIGRMDGTVSRYEAAEPPSAGAVPRFRLVAEAFEGIRIVGQTMGSARHGANTMALADHDGDGDLDLFWGDFFEAGLLLIENTGSCAAPNLRGAPVQFPREAPVLTSGYNAPAFGRLGADGALELVVGVLGGAYNPLRSSVENLYLLTRDAAGAWTVRTRQLLPVLDVGAESVPALADLDGDGDLDLLLGNKVDPAAQGTSRIYQLENVGTARAPAFRLRGALPVEGRFHQAPAAGDLDGDGRTDLLLGQWGMPLAWYRNADSGFVLADSALVTITRGSNTVPTLGDLDGDGDLDLVVGESSGWLNHYRNDGSRTAPRFVLVSDEWAGIRPGRRSAPHLVDIDGDGDLDLLLGGDAGGVLLYRNAGTRQAPRFERDERFQLAAPALSTPAAGDLDGDGVPELVVGNAAGGAVYFARPR